MQELENADEKQRKAAEMTVRWTWNLEMPSLACLSSVKESPGLVGD